MRKIQRSGETIGTFLEVPRDLSLKLSRLIIDRAEKGRRMTKHQLIIEYIEKGVEQEAK